MKSKPTKRGRCKEQVSRKLCKGEQKNLRESEESMYTCMFVWACECVPVSSVYVDVTAGYQADIDHVSWDEGGETS